MFFATVYVVRPLLDRLGRPRLLVASLTVALAGTFWLSRVSAESTYFPDVALPLLVIGVGQGIAIILMTNGGVADLEPHDAGAASGLVNVAHRLGGSLGIATLTIAYARAAGTGATGADLIAGFKAAFTGADVFLVVALVLGIAVAFFTRGRVEALTETAAEAAALTSVE